MRTITREHFIEAIEAGIAAASFKGRPARLLREHGRTAERTLTYTFKRYEAQCPIRAVCGSGIGKSGWAFVYEFDDVASKHVVGDGYGYGTIRVIG